MTSFCANENSKLCNDCGHWAECPECGVCGLCRLYDPPSEQRTYCLKHYRQTFPGKGCDMCEMEARIEALEEKVKGKCKYYRESPNEQYTPTCTGTSWSVHPEDIEGDFCQFCGGKIKLKEYTPIPYHLQEMD